MVGQKRGLSVLFLFLFIQLSKLCIINSCFCVYFRVLRHYVPDIYYDEIIRIKLWSIKSTEQETFFFRQGHATTVVDKKVYIFGGSSGSGFGGQHDESTSDPVYLNDLFVLKGRHVHILFIFN